MISDLTLSHHPLAMIDKVDGGFLQSWLIALGGLALVFLALVRVAEIIKGKKAGETILSPNPLRMERVDALATKVEMRQMGDRLEKDIDGIRQSFVAERANSNDGLLRVHHRIDVVAENTAEIKGTLTNLNCSVSKLLDHAMKDDRKPR